ncbi:MAG: hypothetical protein ABJC79_08885 [Acidimicrobiia bacterium]
MVGTALSTPAEAEAVPAADRRIADAVASALALSVYALLLVVASRWGESLLAQKVHLQIETPPLNGVLDWRLGRTALPAVVCALVLVVALPWLGERLRWTTLLSVAAVGALAWAITLALVDGTAALTDPLLSDQYLRTVTQVGNVDVFLRTFTHRIAEYNIHTQGHPPGMVMVLWVLDRIGLGGVRWNSALVFSGGAAAVVAVLVATRDIAGEQMARRALPFLVLAPAAVSWTSGDPFFAGVSAWAVTALVLATSQSGRRSDALAVVGGLLFAATAFLSYGLVLLAVIPAVIAVWRGRIRVLAIAAAVVVAVVLVIWAVTGFAWWDGLAATRARYFHGVASRRPYDYFLLANLAAFAVIIGPATAVAFTKLRRGPLALLAGAALVVVLLADVSGMSKAEVERIWLPFVPWAMVAGALLATRLRTAMAWLSVQAVGTLVLAVAIRSPW